MRAAVVLAAVCLGWGTIPLVAAETELPAAAIAFGRVAVAAIGLGAIVAVTKPPGPRLLSHRPGRCALVGVLLALHWTAMFEGYRLAPADTVIFLVFLAPVGIAVIERPGARLVAALTVAVVGLALIAGPTVEGGTGDDARGLLFAALAGGLFVALVLLAKPLAAVYGGLRLTLTETAIAAVVLLPAAFAADWSRAPRAAWGWLLLLGLAHTAFGTAVYLWALARLPATEVGILGYMEPVGVVVFGWAIAGARPALTTIIGGALVVAAGIGATLSTVEVPARVAAR